MLCQRLHFTTGAHSPPASAHMSISPSPMAHVQLEEDVKRSTRTGHTYEISSLLLILCRGTDHTAQAMELLCAVTALQNSDLPPKTSEDAPSSYVSYASSQLFSCGFKKTLLQLTNITMFHIFFFTCSILGLFLNNKIILSINYWHKQLQNSGIYLRREILQCVRGFKQLEENHLKLPLSFSKW